MKLRSAYLDTRPSGLREDWQITAEVDGVEGAMVGERSVTATLSDGSTFEGRGLVSASVMAAAGVTLTRLEIRRAGD